MTKKVATLSIALLFAGGLLYSLTESSLEVVDIGYMGKKSSDEYKESWRNLYLQASVDAKNDNLYAGELSKLSKPTWQKINRALNDYDCEKDDVFLIWMVPYGNRSSAECYFLLVRFNSSSKYEWFGFGFYKM